MYTEVSNIEDALKRVRYLLIQGYNVNSYKTSTGNYAIKWN